MLKVFKDEETGDYGFHLFYTDGTIMATHAYLFPSEELARKHGEKIWRSIYNQFQVERIPT